MTRILILSLLLTGCAAMPPRMTATRQQQHDWHYPCHVPQHVASYLADSLTFDRAVRDAVRKLNRAAGRIVLAYAGRRMTLERQGLTIVHSVPALQPDWDAGVGASVTPAYSQRRKCIDHWVMRIGVTGETVAPVVLHELGHVIGLPHADFGIMRAVLLPGQRATITSTERRWIQRTAW